MRAMVRWVLPGVIALFVAATVGVYWLSSTSDPGADRVVDNATQILEKVQYSNGHATQTVTFRVHNHRARAVRLVGFSGET